MTIWRHGGCAAKGFTTGSAPKQNERSVIEVAPVLSGLSRRMFVFLVSWSHMPRVSQQHRDERREQILAAARRCFLRDGFHATSMHDLFAESGLSAGAVYGYFASKDDVIVAIAEENMQGIVEMIRTVATTQPDQSVGETVAAIFEIVRTRHLEDGLAGLAVLVWAEALRNDELRERFTALLRRTPRRSDQGGPSPPAIGRHHQRGRAPTRFPACSSRPFPAISSSSHCSARARLTRFPRRRSRCGRSRPAYIHKFARSGAVNTELPA